MLTTLLVAASLTAAPDIDVHQIGKPKVTGKLVALTADAIEIETADGKSSLPLDGLLRLEVQGEPPPAAAVDESTVYVTLTDGSRLVTTAFTLAKETASTSLLGGKATTIPGENLAAVRFRQHDETIAAQWDKIVAGLAADDRLVVRKNEALEYLEGVVGDISAENVTFVFDGETIPVKRTKIDGVVFHQPGSRRLPDAICRAKDRSGSEFEVRQMSLAGDELKLTTTGGLSISRPLSAFVAFDFSQGNLVYLSDLTPQTSEFTPFFPLSSSLPLVERYYQPRSDRTVTGGPLKLGGKTYAKGLSARSRTRLVYRLAGEYKRLQAIAGIDDHVGDMGHVNLVIQGDNRTLLERPLSGKDEPLEIDLDIAGVQRLTIFVDYGEDVDVADHLDLCNARLLK